MKNIDNVYDREGFYNEYKKMRDGKINANELIEIPTIKSMLPDLKGKTIIDLGCGNGNMSRYFVENGASKVYALDVSNNMIEEAKLNNNLKEITYLTMPLEELDKIDEKFDIAFSSLAFHYIEDFSKLIKDIYNLLNDKGMLIFSQEHPLNTASILDEQTEKYIEINKKRYYLISDYNNNSKREIIWNNDKVIKYHRNFSLTINTIINKGFNLLQIKESKPNDEIIKIVDKYKYQNDRPYFLFVKAQKI